MKGGDVGGSGALAAPGHGDDGHHVALTARHPFDLALDARAGAGLHGVVAGGRGLVGVRPEHERPGHHRRVAVTPVVHRHAADDTERCTARKGKSVVSGSLRHGRHFVHDRHSRHVQKTEAGMLSSADLYLTCAYFHKYVTCFINHDIIT